MKVTNSQRRVLRSMEEPFQASGGTAKRVLKILKENLKNIVS